MVDAASPDPIEVQPADEVPGPTGLHLQADAYRIELAQTFRALERMSGDIAAAFETGSDGAAITGAINVFERLRNHASNNLTSLWAVATSEGSA